jgi:hypothetical protein
VSCNVEILHNFACSSLLEEEQMLKFKYKSKLIQISNTVYTRALSIFFSLNEKSMGCKSEDTLCEIELRRKCGWTYTVPIKAAMQLIIFRKGDPVQTRNGPFFRSTHHSPIH